MIPASVIMVVGDGEGKVVEGMARAVDMEVQSEVVVSDIFHFSDISGGNCDDRGWVGVALACGHAIVGEG